MTKAVRSLRHHVVQVMAAHQGCVLTTGEIYQLVAASGVAGFDPRAKRDRNLVNREFSDLSGRSTQDHGKPSPQLILRVGRGRYLYHDHPAPWTWDCSGSAWSWWKCTRNAPPGGGAAVTGGTFPTRCGWRSMRCGGVSARAAGSTSPTVSGSRRTTSWS